MSWKINRETVYGKNQTGMSVAFSESSEFKYLSNRGTAKII